jgi:foldase protein PrsA
MIARPVSRLIVPVALALVGALAFAGCGGGGGSSSLGAGIVANVDGEKVSQTQLDEVIEQAKTRLEAQGQKIPAAGSAEYQAFQQNALTYLVQKIQFEQQAAELGVTVTDKQVQERLDRLVTQYFGGSKKKYLASLGKQKLTDAQVRAELRTTLISEALFKKVGAGASVSDTDVEDYYKSHPEIYSQPAARDVAHILVKSKVLADRLYGELQNGAKFAVLAKKHSLDSSKSIGGKLTIRKGETVPEFEKVALAIKTGEVAEPVKTQFGWHIITALGPMKEGSSTPLADVKATIRQTLESQAQSQAVTTWLANLKTKYAKLITYAEGFAPPSTETATTTATG